MVREGKKRRARGFSLMEVLVVVGILIVLVGILIPVISKARERGKVSATAGTINSLVIAIEAYRAEMSQYPRHSIQARPRVNSGGSDCGYGYVALAKALVGFQDASGDKADGFGFRREAEGRVYGPYMNPTGKNYKVFRSKSDLPNPVDPTGGAWASSSSENNGREYGAGGGNQGFVDAWGQPIFYWVGNAQQGSQGQLDQDFFSEPGDNTNNNRSYVFVHSNPDAVSGLEYTVNGQAIKSRLVAYTPAGKWDPATTPWGVATALDGDRLATANPLPGLKFRALIGSSNPASSKAKSTDRIVGRNSFLLAAAGPDNQYFTGDEIINEANR